MDVREKLVELLKQTEINKINGHTALAETCFTPNVFENMATNLIAHGVTVQEWIPVKDRLPENDQWVLCFMKDKAFGTFRVFQWNYIDWQWNDGNEWYDEKDVTHWMPLPEPPKEGESDAN